MMQIPILVPTQYNMLSSVHTWIYPDIQPVPEITWNHFFSRVITMNADVQIPVIIEQEKSGDALSIHFSNDLVKTSELKKKIQSMFCLSTNTKKVLSAIQNDPSLYYLKAKLEGIKPYLSDTLYEALVKSIIQQQISYRVANMLTKRLILGLTKPILFCNTEVYKFPYPSLILETGTEQLRSFGLGKKSEYITQISSAIVSGDLDLNSLRDSSYEEIVEVLNPIKGIGTWTIGAFCIAGLGKFSVFPYGDKGVRNLLAKLYDSKDTFSKREVIDKSESWGMCGPMVLYLLMCADVLGLIEEKPSDNA